MAAYFSDKRQLPSRGNSEIQVMDEGVLSEGIKEAVVESEKMIPQSKLNEIVGREKAAAAEKARREMEAQMQMQAQREPENMNPAIDAEGLKKQVYDQIMAEAQAQRDRAAEEEHKQAMEAVAQQYFLKMGKGKETFEDFDEVMSDFEPAAFPQVVFLAAELENTPAVMYELSKNPAKLAAIDTMAAKSPKQARAMLQKLSESISNNEAAKQNNISTNEPLSRLKSSTVGADNGVMNLRDLKKSPFLRG